MMRSPTDLAQDSLTASQVAEQLHLPLSKQIWKGQSGDFRGAGVGSSLDFQDHRDYHPGDDPRHINWQAYARTGQYSMKVFSEEVRPVIDLFLDVSSSMFTGDSKSRRTSELLYFLAASAQRANASLHCTLILGDTSKPLSLDTLLNHRWPEEIASLSPTDAALPPNLDLAPKRPNAIRILLSDLLFAGDPLPILRPLHERQGTGLIFAPYSQDEANPSWSGSYEFVDAERHSRHNHQINSAALTRYQENYQNHFTAWSEASRRQQIALSRVDAELPLFKSLQTEAVRLGALEIAP